MKATRSWALVLLLALCALLFSCAEQAPPTGLLVEVLDVGQSDCTLVRCGEAVLMIDTGTATEREAVQAALRDRDIEELEYLLLTHPHEDHIGNARMILESYTVSTLLTADVVTEDPTYGLVLSAAAHRGTPCVAVSAAQTLALGDAQIEVLSVLRDAKDINDSSVILRVTYGGTAFLFTGDAEAAGEAALLASVPAEKLDCDVLKAGHHGSDTSTGKALLQAATPRYVAISCGENNDYGFPHAALLARLEACGAAWHRTDLSGDLTYRSDGETVTVALEK